MEINNLHQTGISFEASMLSEVEGFAIDLPQHPARQAVTATAIAPAFTGG
jgi:hypothetical protein